MKSKDFSCYLLGLCLISYVPLVKGKQCPNIISTKRPCTEVRGWKLSHTMCWVRDSHWDCSFSAHQFMLHHLIRCLCSHVLSHRRTAQDYALITLKGSAMIHGQQLTCNNKHFKHVNRLRKANVVMLLVCFPGKSVYLHGDIVLLIREKKTGL